VPADPSVIAPTVDSGELASQGLPEGSDSNLSLLNASSGASPETVPQPPTSPTPEIQPAAVAITDVAPVSVDNSLTGAGFTEPTLAEQVNPDPASSTEGLQPTAPEPTIASGTQLAGAEVATDGAAAPVAELNSQPADLKAVTNQELASVAGADLLPPTETGGQSQDVAKGARPSFAARALGAVSFGLLGSKKEPKPSEGGEADHFSDNQVHEDASKAAQIHQNRYEETNR